MNEFDNNNDLQQSGVTNIPQTPPVAGFNNANGNPPVMPTAENPVVNETVPPVTPPVYSDPAAPQSPVMPDPFSAQNFVTSVPSSGPGVVNPIQYSPISEDESRRRSGAGLRIFCIAVALMILITGSALGGYMYGKESVTNKGYNYTSPEDLYKDVEVDLSAKPKDTDQYTAAEVYAQLNESIVGIRVYNEKGSMSEATGVIYTEDGYIVTNDHIYSEVGAPKFKIYMHDGTQYNAQYVAGDVVSDLAVLKIIDGEKFKPATFGNSNELFCGEHVVALGRPSGASDATTVTSGIISLTARRVSNTSNYSARLIQTDSAINPGSSGGALVNMYGQVIGITSSKLASATYDNIGFAIPTTTMQRVVTQLISEGKVSDRAKLGITYTELNSVTAEVSGAPAVGIYVATVSTDSDLYGKVFEGDIITKINGVEVTCDEIVLDIIEDCRAGDTVTITVVDEDGEESEFDAVLGANVGESSYSEIIESDDDDENVYGGTFDFPFGE